MSEELKSYNRITIMAAVGMLLVGAYPLYHWYGFSIMFAFLLALVITFLNAAVGFYYIDKYFSASLNDLLKVVFGSMGIRLLALGLAFVALLGFTEIHKVSFTVSLFISYILFSVIEIYFLNKKASKPDT